MNWLNLPKNKQKKLFNQLSVRTGIPPQAIEKDAWVTLVLKMIFSTDFSDYLVFKGGTSLSKAYNLIKRFSEDIDLAISKEFLGFGGNLTKGQIRKLRRKSHDFVSNEILNALTGEFKNKKIDNQLFKIEVKNTKISDQDPETIVVFYQSVFEELPYIKHKVLVEIGARSLLEPSENKEIMSIIDYYFKNTEFSDIPFKVKVVRPEKTFLEKLILLHEEFTKPFDKIRHHRMSRHLYDIGEIIETKFGINALKDKKLFNEIILHRKLFTPVKTVEYDNLNLENLNYIPPKEIFEKYENDYNEMRENMIYGKSVDFEKLINKIKLIASR